MSYLPPPVGFVSKAWIAEKLTNPNLRGGNRFSRRGFRRYISSTWHAGRVESHGSRDSEVAAWGGRAILRIDAGTANFFAIDRRFKLPGKIAMCRGDMLNLNVCIYRLR